MFLIPSIWKFRVVFHRHGCRRLAQVVPQLFSVVMPSFAVSLSPQPALRIVVGLVQKSGNLQQVDLSFCMCCQRRADFFPSAVRSCSCVHLMASDGESDLDARIADEERLEAEMAVACARMQYEDDQAFQPDPFVRSPGASSSRSSAAQQSETSLSPSTRSGTPPKRAVAEKMSGEADATPTGVAAQPSRKRLRTKTSVFQARPAILPIQKTQGVWDKFNTTQYDNNQKRYQAVWYRLKWWLDKEETHAQMVPDIFEEEVLWRSRIGFRTLLPNEKVTVTRAFLDNTDAPQVVRDIIEQTYPSGQSRTSPSKKIYAKGAMLTYHGEWGKMPEDYVKAGTDEEGVLAQLQRDGKLSVLWASFHGFAGKIASEYRASAWASCMELCLDTFQAGGGIRVHCHMGLKSETSKMYIHLDALQFRDSLPHVRATLPGIQVRSAGSWAQIYYCLAPKLGVVYQVGSHEPFKQFPVKGDWPFGMLQAGKMGAKTCREQLIRAGRGIVRLLNDFDRYMQSMEELKLESRIAEYRTELKKTQKVLVDMPQVQTWMESATKPFQRRKRFLVLEGPSGLGKTEYIKALFGPDNVLELNCGSCGTVVSLRQFRAHQHRCVLFDEASAALVLHNRKVFQAPPTWVDLGHSPTGRDIYSVFLADAVLVVNSNRWSEELEKIKKTSVSDHAWLVANMCLVKVSSKLYVE